jgi:phosphoenolpyruvate carboxykinase (GTP)
MQIPSYVLNTHLRVWVEEMVALCRPDQIHWCDGSQAEYDGLCEQMVASGTFICSLSKADAGPTNNWVHPRQMKETLKGCSTAVW